MPRVNVRWKGQTFTVEADTTQPLSVFKEQLSTLSNVPIKFQSIMVDKRFIRTDDVWSATKLREDQKVYMLGNRPRSQATTALEEENVDYVVYNRGLFNAGNTCYANSTLQCFYAILELRVAIFEYDANKTIDPKSRRLTTSLKNLFDGIDDNRKAISPLEFLGALRNKYPNFAKMKDRFPMQQDAMECWTSVMDTLSDTLKGPDYRNQYVKDLFGIHRVHRRQYQVGEAVITRVEPVISLRCLIPYVEMDLLEGLKQSYTSQNVLDSSRCALAKDEYLITDFSRYLTIHINRFWVLTGSGEKVKGAQKVNCPLQLDIYTLCSEDLCKKLDGYRPSETSGLRGVKRKAELLSTESGETSRAIFEGSPAKTEQLTGIYDLVAVLTHKGRSANSGHYIAYVKHDTNQWIQFDDDTVKPQDTKDITELFGGDLERDMAYILLYKAQTDDVWSATTLREDQKIFMFGNRPRSRAANALEEEKLDYVDFNRGLFDLGNTCYANSTLQCLYAVPELRVAVLEYAANKRVDAKLHMLTNSLKLLFNGLDDNQKAICPLEFLRALRNKYPKFKKMKDRMPMQQDALDCWNSVIDTLYQTLKGPDYGNQYVKELFGIHLVRRRQYEVCGEVDFTVIEPVISLRCMIPSVEIDLLEGLKQSHTSTKAFDSSRSAVANEEYLITDFSRYFTIHFNRFCVMTDSKEKVKIAQKVNYPLELDVYNLCSEDLCRKLEGYRQAEKLGFNPSETSGVSDKDVKCKAELLSTESGETSRGTFKEGSPANKEQLTGIYDLVVVLTHKGRSANSGHYIAYVKQESGLWIQFDDDTVKPQHPEDITKLCGGDLERDIAYILLYKARATSV